MALAAQAIKNQEILKTEYLEKAAIGALYDELSKGIDSMKKGDVYTIDEAWAFYPDCSLADLNDEIAMPPELRKVHQFCVAELMKM